MRPAQLPTDHAAFAGRQAEIARLTDLVTDGGDPRSTAVIGLIGGAAGIGKTTFAVHCAHRVARHFPDGQLFVNLRGFDPSGAALDPSDALRGFLVALGVPPRHVPAGLDDQTALYRSLLAGRRVLVLLDNARDEQQVRPLLPGVPGCPVVVTSRNQLGGLVAAEGARPLRLGLPDPGDIRESLARGLGAARTDAEPGAVDDIIRLCARLPLAVAIVTARAALNPDFSLTAVAAELRRTHGSLEAFTSADVASDVRAVFSWSYRALSTGAARLFRLIALHPGPDLSTHAAASLAGLPPPAARALLNELAAACLADEHVPGRFTVHDLLRAYASELVAAHDREEDRDAAYRRLLDHYGHTALSAGRWLTFQWTPPEIEPPGPAVSVEEITDHRMALRWFTAEHRVLNALILNGAGTGLDKATRRIAWGAQAFFACKEFWTESIAAQTAVLRDARRRGDRGEEARCLRTLGGVHAMRGRSRTAVNHLDQAMAAFEELGDPLEQARTQFSFAFVFHQDGRDHAALLRAERGLALARAGGHALTEAEGLNAVGWFRSVLGDHEHALSVCRESLQLLRGLEAVRPEACVWDSLGHIHHHLGRYDRALSCYERAIVLFREVADRRNEAGTLGRLGDTHRAAGRPHTARAAWTRALELLEELGRPGTEDLRAKLDSLGRARSA
ncbi:ATP-binding protein [Streptomyces lycii]|uniref:Tetratricopeptide repeat protein n=1 Tax=Streptomyces lycii TaxID=2654337 RepID=A0ABQ7FFM7_9ACTN|nr:tetratricopeptide repeat protein [Streptomyces lycii]KAF4407640.1 tetratricopeptide repeat protein [Streptomyces lycii]